MAFDLEGLKARISRLAVRSEDGRSFYPAENVAEVLTNEVVRQLVDLCIDEYVRRRETIALVRQGGRKLLIVLILINQLELLDKFIDTHTTHEKATLDTRLPFAQETLLEMFAKESNPDTLASSFFERQWEVLAPRFQPNFTHRTFADMQVLPFLFNSAKPVGEGAFGYVEKVELHRSHCGFPTASPGIVGIIFRLLFPQPKLCAHADPNVQAIVVRKRIKQTERDSDETDSYVSKSEDATTESFREEARILTLLRVLKHPCIVEVLGSYTFRKTQYLLFPPADFTLADALSSGKLSSFESSALLYSIIGLMSAIKHVHSYFSDEYQLQMVGCHRDLKPKNILILGTKFLLADFGLSRLKEGDDSKSFFRTGDRNYMAPECETIETSGSFTVQKNIVGRATDIWALGGILTEIVTCRLKGSEGFRAYRNARKKTIGGILMVCQFHDGGKTCVEVEKWIQNLRSGAPPDQLELLELATACLEIDTTKRPTIDKVLSEMHRALHLLRTKSALVHFEKLMSEERSLEIEIEHERLRLWSLALKSDHHQQHRQHETWYQELQELSLEQIHDTIKLIEAQIVSLRDAVENPVLVPIIHPLRELVTKLWRFLPEQISDDLQQRLISRILNEDKNQLDSNQHGIEVIGSSSELGLYVAMKQVTALLIKRQFDFNAVYLKDKLLTEQTELGLHKIGLMRQRGAEDDEGVAVLLEQVEYNASWADQSHREELLDRVATITSLLRQPFLVPEVRLLSCLGFQHHLEHHSITLIYELQAGVPKTLRQVLRTTNENRRLRPMLGSVFKFAHNLARSIMQYHLLEWLHKNIAADNILFFPTDSSSQALVEAFDKPYLIGFNHARQSNDQALSHGPTNIQILRHYVDPEYLAGKLNGRFHWRYDFYSLGILLLEVGVWRCVSDWTTSEKWRKLRLSPFDLRRKIIDELVPILGSTMGRTYMDTVTACLTKDFKDAGHGLENVLLSFKEQVVNPLGTLLMV